MEMIETMKVSLVVAASVVSLEVSFWSGSVGTFTTFPLTPMGVLAPGSAHVRPSAQAPIDMSGNFPAHVSAESPSKISKKN